MSFKKNFGTVLAVSLAAVLSVSALAAENWVYEDDNLKIGQYDGLPYTVTLREITDEDLQEEIDSTMEWFAESEQILEGEAKEGDTVNIDYVGTVDGEEFDGGSDTDTDLTLGSGMFLEDFEKGVIGMTPGETKDVEVSFPEDYFNEDMAGAQAVFSITLNYICGEDIIPEFNEEFVKENFDVSSTEEYLANARQQLEDDALEEFESERESQVLEALVEISEVKEVDEDLIEEDVNSAISTYQYYAAMYGVSYEDFLAEYGLDPDTFEEQMRETARTYEEQKLVIAKIAELEGIEASDEEVEEYLEDMAEEYGYDSVDDLKSELESEGYDAVEDTKEQLLTTLVRQWLVDHAVQVEAEETDADEEVEAIEDEELIDEEEEAEAEE